MVMSFLKSILANECVFYLFELWVAGMKFLDITTLLLNAKAFKNTIDLFVERYRGKKISVVAGRYSAFPAFSSIEHLI